MYIAVVDGQGGGVGKQLVEKLRREFGNNARILALGTNSTATGVMLKAGADEAATGENAIAVCCRNVDYITGMAGILCADSMMGELTASMAQAISTSPAKKVLIPVNRCNLFFAGMQPLPLGEYIDAAVQLIKQSKN